MPKYQNYFINLSGPSKNLCLMAHLVRETREVKSGDPFTIKMEKAGGFVMIVE